MRLVVGAAPHGDMAFARHQTETGPTMTDVLPCLRALISDPQRVSALAPSSTALADLITSEITPASAPVIELGPGTGVFTRALLARGVPREDLVLVEAGADFARSLQLRFPDVRILAIDRKSTRLNSSH